MRETFLSLGLGQQTVALLVLATKGKLKIDEAVFADTGGEHEETYDYLRKIAQPMAEKAGIPFTIVTMAKNAYERETKEARVCHSLEGIIGWRRRIPSIRMRWCTEYSKITPIKLYIREKQKRGEYVKPARAIIGISFEERLRMHKPHLSEYVTEYPLVERQLVRQDCKQIILAAGYPLPPKSGCYFCPFQSREAWHELYKKDPQKYWKSVEMEERDPGFPGYRLHKKPLRDLAVSFGEGSYSLDDFEIRGDMSCEQAGYCHV